MASVLPRRPNTNSTGTTTSSTSQTGRPSLLSARSHSGSASMQNGFSEMSLSSGAHKSTMSGTLNPFGEHGYQSMSPATRPTTQRTAAPRRPRMVRSQYPANSGEKHVEYILVASFDIDRGSIMEHQYPAAVGGDEHMLAELMLPDQAHVRSQDWTIFFLHKDPGQEEDENARRRRRRRRRRALARGEVLEPSDDDSPDDGEWEADEYDDESSEDEPDINPDGPPLVYVLNLVNTKQDNTVKRGAVVKAMAICTRHSFLHIYKPLLLLALEQYFASPTVETLAGLYDAVNSMDLSLMPKLNYLEKFILQASDAKDLFLEKFEAIIAQRVQAKQEPLAGTLDAQGQGSKARFGLPRDTHEFESVVHYANVPVPVKIPTAVVAETVGDFSLIKLIQTFSPQAAAPVPFNPTHPHLTTSGPTTNPIIVLLNALLTQKRVIFLGHNLPSSEVAEAVLAACALASGGLLRGYTRHAFPYTDLTKIDDLLKVPGFIAGVTNPAFAHKAEWWDLLCDLGTGKMRISNRIEQAAVTDGVLYFAQNGAGLPSKESAGISALVVAGASLSAGLGGNAVPTGSITGDPTGDVAFMQSVLAAIQERHGENAIRTKFRKWVVKFTRLAASFEETVYGASALHINPPENGQALFGTAMGGAESPSLNAAHAPPAAELHPEVTGHGYVWPTLASKMTELAANATRIEGWRNTRSYYNFVQDLAAFYVHRPIKRLDLQHLTDRLAKLRLTPDAAAAIFTALATAVRTPADISQLLTTIANGVWENRPSASAGAAPPQGLLYIGMGLFHPRIEVREQVADLLGRIRDHEAGRHYWNALGRFVKMAWERVMMVRSEREEREEVR